MVQVNLLTVVVGLFFLGVLYNLLIDNKNKTDISFMEKLAGGEKKMTEGDFGHSGTTHDSGRAATSEVVYTQDYYPWWRSTRWWNYDGWLYQKPYYNYWRRPYYASYWRSGKPLIVGGKRYYRREYY